MPEVLELIWTFILFIFAILCLIGSVLLYKMIKKGEYLPAIWFHLLSQRRYVTYATLVGLLILSLFLLIGSLNILLQFL